jgi:hypothetical protein
MSAVFFLQWFFAMWYETTWTKIPLNILTLSAGLDQVAAILISFGGLIGKISPLQLVMMTILECIFYSINKSIFLVGALGFIDGTPSAASVRTFLCNTDVWFRLRRTK